MKKEIQIQSIIKFISDLEGYQQKKLIKLAQNIIPNITEEDLLQPFDFPNLEENPLFRYEEGVLHGIKLVISAINASLDDF